MAEKMALITVAEDVPPASTLAPHGLLTPRLPQTCVAFHWSLGLAMSLMCVCTVILTKWEFIEATTADEFKRDTGRVGLVTGGPFVHTHCSVVVYWRFAFVNQYFRQTKSTPVDLNVFWTAGQQNLCSIPEGKLFTTMCASNHALFIHGNRKCSASCFWHAFFCSR